MLHIQIQRENAGLSQSALARASGVPQSVIWDIENNPGRMPRIDTVQKIAIALGVTIDELLSEAGA